MKAKNVLDKLKDLKLRRWGSAEFLRRVKISEFNNKEFGDSVVRTHFDEKNISYDNVDYWPDLYVNNNTEILNSYEDFVLCGLGNIDYFYKNAPYNLQDSDFNENNKYEGTVGENDKIYIGNCIGSSYLPAIAKVNNIISVYKVQKNGETYYALHTSIDK